MRIFCPQLPPSVVILDLDGTLTDSIPAVTGAFAQMVKEQFGKTLPPEYFTKYVGPPLLDSMKELQPEGDRASHEYLIERYREFYMPVAHDVPLYPGVKQVLEILIDKGARLAVATSKLESSAVEVLRNTGILDFFETVNGAISGVNSALKEESIQAALNNLGMTDQIADPCPVVMVGDRVYDVQGAGVFGIPTVFCTWANTSKPDERQGAWAVCERIQELPELLGYKV